MKKKTTNCFSLSSSSCQCHTMCQSEGDMQVQLAHSKKIPLGEKKIPTWGASFFFGGYPRRAMRQRILGSHTPPCHRRMVITTQFNVLPCCTATQTSSVPLQVAFDCALTINTYWSARTHHPPTVLVSL